MLLDIFPTSGATSYRISHLQDVVIERRREQESVCVHVCECVCVCVSVPQAGCACTQKGKALPVYCHLWH